MFGAARFTVQYVRAVGQDVSPGKCVLLHTSKAVKRSMKYWDVSGDGRSCFVQLDVRDLGGHSRLYETCQDGYSLPPGARGYSPGCSGWRAAFRISGQIEYR